MKPKLLTILVVLALVIAACGGGEDGAGDAAATTVATGAGSTIAGDAGQTTATTQPDTTTTAEVVEAGGPSGETLGDKLLAAADQEVVSARFEAVFSFVPAPGAAEVPEGALTMNGEFDNRTGNARFEMDFGALMESVSPGDLEGLPPEMLAVFDEPLEMITVGDTAYMKWGFFNLLLGAEGWIELPADETDDVTGQFGFGAQAGSPTEMLEQLREADAAIEEVGRETVRGVETTHYLVTVNLKELAEQLPADEQAELEEQFGDTSIEEFPMEIWIGDDGLVYRYQIILDATVMEAEDLGEVESVTMTFEIYDYGAEIVVEPPDPSEVTSIEELGGFFGGGG